MIEKRCTALVVVLIVFVVWFLSTFILIDKILIVAKKAYWKIEAFDTANEDWSTFVEWIEPYFLANEIDGLLKLNWTLGQQYLSYHFINTSRFFDVYLKRSLTSLWRLRRWEDITQRNYEYSCPVRLYCIQECTKNLPLLVVETHGPALFGRNWLNEFQLTWKMPVKSITKKSSKQDS